MIGIDLDWEYPGAPDIPGIPSADPIDGPNYLELLKLIRSQLPDKYISIAAPASFWYLRAFPIEENARVVDYIVYMTYDLHGQWDYGNKWSSDGCANGDCLRSHINNTETANALVMITKAGVPSNKIIVGVTSYGRAFRMTTPGCTGPDCKYTGPDSGAKPGRCTKESGYIFNAEIKEIIANNPSARTFIDDTASNILVYDDVEWVGYMDDDNKRSRTADYRALNFGGVTDWAVDLDSFIPENSSKPGEFFEIGNGGWRDTNCSNSGMSDASLNPQWRWDALQPDQAWADAKAYWKSQKGGTELQFSATASNFFNGHENMACGTIKDANPCLTPYLCVDGDRSGPAATFILNSFVALHGELHNLYNILSSARASLGAGKIIDRFVKEFTPDKDDILWTEIMLNFLGLGFGMVVAPFFNSLLRSSRYFATSPNTLDTLKDDTYGLIAFSVGTAKDNVKQSEFSTDVISGVVDIFFNVWKTSVTAVTSHLFSGGEATLPVLEQIIATYLRHPR